MHKVKPSTFILVIISLVLIADQTLKIWVKLNMSLYEHYSVLGQDWFQLYFTENKGMAFGLEWGGDIGKLFLSLFRLVTLCALFVLLKQMCREWASKLILLSFSLIFAGALGNMIDALFYGVFFSQSGMLATAEFLPQGGGYAGPLYGRVVDMLYFPLIDWSIPRDFPVVGGHRLRFFQAIFNIADIAICMGVGLIFIFNKRFFGKNGYFSKSFKKNSKHS